MVNVVGLMPLRKTGVYHKQGFQNRCQASANKQGFQKCGLVPNSTFRTEVTECVTVCTHHAVGNLLRVLSPYRWRNKLGKFVSFNPDCWGFTMDVSQALMCVHVANILVVLGLIPSPIVKLKSERKAKGIIWE